MNFLAHLHVGKRLGPIESAGNLLADYCREDGCAAFREGVQLHRAIDAFTDRHPIAGEARALFNPSYPHFGGVLSDLAFDWCLARNWEEWSSDMDLGSFVDSGLGEIVEHRGALPSDGAYALGRMVDQGWLQSYATIEGMRVSLERIAKRRPIAAKMLGAERLMKTHEEALDAIFRRFYPELLVLGEIDEGE